MKNDMEYNTVQEFAALPDEYLQGGGNKSAESRKGKATWKRMMYMAAAFVVMAYTAVGAYASNTPFSPQTDNLPLTAEESEASKEPENQTEEQQPVGQEEHEEMQEEAAKEQTGNAELTTLQYYPIEDGTSYYVVYNDTYDPDNNWNNRILEEGAIFESLLAQGMDYALPEYEPEEGYVFLGWVIYYEDGNIGMAGDSLNASNICYVKPENGSRSIEVHAAWRHDGIGEWAHLLTLDANGGTIENESSVTYDADGPMASGSYVYLCAYPVPVREGYTFAGWYAEPDCSGRQTTRLIGLDFYEKNGDDYDWST
ncbi:MAG: InlB B-repeat-containing protein, partial [Lachnospiraceae bacterium]